VSRETIILPKAELFVCENSLLSLLFTWRERVVIKEMPLFEKVVIITDDMKPKDPGIHEVIVGEYIQGELEEREVIDEKGPIIGREMLYFENRAITNELGILIDEQQSILSLFDDLRRRQIFLQFISPGKTPEIIKLEIPRTEFNQTMGLNFTDVIKSHPGNLDFSARWDRSFYRAGDRGKLTVTARNTGTDGMIGRVQARSMSRWSWLDGKHFYVGDLEPQTEKSFFRYFHIPGDIQKGKYYLRLGVNEHSGAKPQFPITIMIVDF
jgi:hypothetical protein